MTEDKDDISPAKQLQDTIRIFNALNEFSSNPLQKIIESKAGELADDVIEQAFSRHVKEDPLRRSMDSVIQRMIIENIDAPNISNRKEGSSISQRSKDIKVYKRLSPGDIYIMRIIGDELDYIKNHDGEVIYKKIKLSP